MNSFKKTVLTALLFVLPTVALFELDNHGYIVGGAIFATVFMISVIGLLAVVYSDMEKNIEPLTPIRNEDPKKFAVKPTFYRLFLPKGTHIEDNGKRIVYVGKLLDRADIVFKKMREEFDSIGYLPILTDNTDQISKKTEGPVRLILASKQSLAAESEKPSVLVNVLLIILTVFSLMWVISTNHVTGLPGFELLLNNISWAVSITAVLIFGEWLRYLISKYIYGIDVSYPLFLPVPTGFGTFGSINKIRSPIFDRKSLFETTYAGAVFGLVIGCILLFYEFDMNIIVPAGASPSNALTINLGSSLLLSLAAKNVFGVEIGSGHMLAVNPQTFSGWMIILITSVSLMPLGELAGGRITRAIFGRMPALIINRIVWVLVLSLGIVHWSGWLVFAFVVFIVSYNHRTKVFNQISPVSLWQKALGIIMLLFALLVLTPLPHSFYKIFGLHCPYL